MTGFYINAPIGRLMIYPKIVRAYYKHKHADSNLFYLDSRYARKHQNALARKATRAHRGFDPYLNIFLFTS